MRKAFGRARPLHFYFLEHVRRHPAKQCIVEVDTGRAFSFAELNQLANKYANALKVSARSRTAESAQAEPYHSPVVALFLENSADFFAIWLGLSKVGVVTAWINSNLKLEPLAHSIRVAKTNKVITSSALLPSESAEQLLSPVQRCKRRWRPGCSPRTWSSTRSTRRARARRTSPAC